jgi:hypothetical protein
LAPLSSAVCVSFADIACLTTQVRSNRSNTGSGWRTKLLASPAWVQRYLAHKKAHPPGTLPYAYA